jgi:hypothetical protein
MVHPDARSFAIVAAAHIEVISGRLRSLTLQPYLLDEAAIADSCWTMTAIAEQAGALGLTRIHCLAAAIVQLLGACRHVRVHHQGCPWQTALSAVRRLGALVRCHAIGQSFPGNDDAVLGELLPWITRAGTLDHHPGPAAPAARSGIEVPP